MVPGKEAIIRKNPTTHNGIMAGENSDNDHANTDKREENDTSQELSRNDETKNKLIEQWKKKTCSTPEKTKTG